ncbi:MAG: hypothetical protein ACI9R3_004851 [Verrucomicrobiales bacterium]|jgi:hypothetical protein
MKIILLSLLLFLPGVPYLRAATPNVLNHQGRIAVNGVNYNGTGHFKFTFVTGDGTQTFWANDGTAGGEPASAVPVPVSNGHYTVALGDPALTNMTTPVTASIFSANSDVRLRVWFAMDPTDPFELLSPDHRITTVGYAFSAAGATLAAGYETGSGPELSFQGVSVGTLTLSATFNSSFSETPTVQLADGWSVTASTGSAFTASASFSPRTIDSDGIVGSDTSLTVINGRPAVAYRDAANGDLLYMRAFDSSGASWPESPTRIAGAITDVGRFASLAEVNGRPAVAYYNSSTGNLEYVRSADANGSSWPLPIVVDGAAENVGRHASLKVIGGVPAISYQVPNSGQIRYAWAGDTAGTTWSTVTVDGSVAQYSEYTSLASVLDRPAIAYRNTTNGNLRYAYLSGSDPANPLDWTKLNVFTTGDVGMFPSLAVVNGNPAISYYDSTTTNLRYARAVNATGATWTGGIKAIVESSVGDVGTHASLAVISGRPAVSYRDATAGDLKWAIASNANGTTWSAANRLVIDGDLANVGAYSSLASVDGLPAIAYQDETSFDLKYASLPAASWSASNGTAESILASGVKDGGVTEAMLDEDLGIWKVAGNDLVYQTGRIGIGRVPTANALEVEGTASKTTAGSWLANSDREIKTDVRELDRALETILKIRLVDFEYTSKYREEHPFIDDRRFPNVIAQEFAEVFPEWVQASGEDQILQVDTYPILIYSAAAIQELAEKLQLEGKHVESLEAQNAMLLKRLESIEAKVETLSN